MILNWRGHSFHRKSVESSYSHPIAPFIHGASIRAVAVSIPVILSGARRQPSRVEGPRVGLRHHRRDGFFLHEPYLERRAAGMLRWSKMLGRSW